MNSDSPSEGLLSQSTSGSGLAKTSSGGKYTGRRMSFGIGGAGNIRNVTEATIHDFYAVQDGQQPRRRSSAGESATASSPSRTSRLIDGMKSIFGSSPPKDSEKRSS